MKWSKRLILGSLVVMISACSAAFDNSRYYMPEFSPENVVIPVCPHIEARTAHEIDSVIVFQKPFPGGRGPHREGWIPIWSGGVSGGHHWIPLDGSVSGCCTSYSIGTRVSIECERDQERFGRFRASADYASEEIKERRTLQHHGLVWEYVYVGELTRYPESLDGRGAGPNPPPGP